MEKKKVLFAHIPKTAGQSTNFMLTANFNIEYKYLMHIPLKEVYQDYKDYFKFTIVRDPIYRCISAYYYIKRLKETKNKNYIDKLSFIKLTFQEKIQKEQKETVNSKYKQKHKDKKIKKLQDRINNIDIRIKHFENLLENKSNESNESNQSNESNESNENNNNINIKKSAKNKKNILINKLGKLNKKLFNPRIIKNKIYKNVKILINKSKIKRHKRIKELLEGPIEEFIENFQEFYNLTFYKKDFNKIKFSKKEQAINCLWIPQYVYIYDNNDNLLVDKILKMNEFYDYLIENDIIKMNNYTHNKNYNITDYSHLINDKFKETIRKIYKKDYELLGNFF